VRGRRPGGPDGVDGPDLDVLAAAYAVGALEGVERLEVEARMAADPGFAARVADLQQAVAAMGAAVPLTPPPELHDRVMAALDDVEQLPPLAPAPSSRAERHLAAVPPVTRRDPQPDVSDQRRPVLAVLVAAVVAGLFAAAGIGGWQLLQPRAQQQEVAGALDRITAAPDATTVTAAPASAGRWRGTQLVYSRSQGEGVVTAEEPLPELDDRVYQLWRLDDEGVPVAAGAFTEGEGALVEGGVRDTAAVAVTVEEQEGLAAPTTPVLAVYELAT
jgi:anti-sigma-K factor RskA